MDVSYSGPTIAKTIISNAVAFRIPPPSVCSNTGSITRDFWSGIGGNAISNIPVTTTPTSTTTLTILESPSNSADNYGERLRGYICAPYTGGYTFWIASDDDSELWLSNSTSPNGKTRIAYLNGAVGSRNWDANASQKSNVINLTAGQQYYVEVLHKEGGGDDYLAVGWQMPTGAYERPIPGIRLLPYTVVNANPVVSITAPTNNATYIATSNITFTANATDSDGSISKVEFYNGTSLIGTAPASPYTISWNNVSAGTYTITAKATDNQNATSTSTAITVNVSPLRTPENPASTTAGLTYKYYEGPTWSVLPDFTSLTPVKSGISPAFDISIRNRNDNYGISFTGFINVPTDGIYTFYTNSDDGSKLFIGSTEIVNNDGAHGDQQRSGVVGLKAGKHAITVVYFQGVFGYSLNVAYSGPGITQQTITASALFNNNLSPVVAITSPANNATFVATSAIAFTATATDADGNIAKVEFYDGTNLLGTSTASPYTFNWNNVAAGTYSITAKATDNYGAVSTSAVVSIVVSPLRTPENPSGTSAGIVYMYYEGSWNTMPDFTTLTPIKSGIVSTITNSVRNRDENYGISFTGFVNVPTDGIYTFYTNSDDGSNLYIGSTLVLNNDGIHGDQQRSGGIGLKAGKHAFTVNYFQKLGGYSLAASYAGPGIAQQTIPSSALFNTTIGPMVNITAPLTGTAYTAPASINMAANASSTSGAISKVEFYNGTVLIGTSTSSPYNFNWPAVAAGSYTLTAKAYDNLALNVSSVAVNVSVNDPANKNPTIVITAPSSNSSLMAPANITITTTPADQDGTISKVEFYNGTVLLGTVTSAPFNYSWANVAAGTYTIAAKAYDNAGGTAGATVNVSVSTSVNANPIVSLSAPVNNSVYTAPAAVTIAASASDSDGSISKVEFYNGTTLLSTSASSPYTYNWSNIARGNYTITAKAYDNLGATSSASISITVKAANLSPVISIVSPANNASFTAPASIAITTSVSDPDGTISKVEFYNGTVLLSTVTSSPYNFTWANSVAGNYTIVAKAYDNLNESTSASVAVKVMSQNINPVVTITSPSNNSSFNAPAAITISANASDQDGTVAKMEFYNGTALLGTATTSPYNFFWNNVGAAPYTITVKAYDNLGAVASASVSITVNAVSVCAALATYTENNGYVAGSKVKNTGSQYQCKPWPYSGWCNGAAWAYEPGTGAYWTDAWDYIGSCTPSAPIVTGTEGLSEASILASAFPNPFENKTTIQFDLRTADHVNIALYNSQGVYIEEVFNGYLSAGHQNIDYANQSLADGTYLCKIQNQDKLIVVKLVKVARPKK